MHGLAKILKKSKLLLFLLITAILCVCASFLKSVVISSNYPVNASGDMHPTLVTLSEGVVNVRDFGARGNYKTDDTAAIIAADAHAAAEGKPLYFPAGVYRCTDSIDKTASKWIGTGAPVLGTFPLTTDDKRFLRPGKKRYLPGSSLIFSGKPTKSVMTQRTDRFDSFTYCVKAPKKVPGAIEGMAIVQDMDVFDSKGNITDWSRDRRARDYQVGYYIEDGTGNYHRNFVVFGYFSKAGIVIHSREGAFFEGDPDYNVFDHGSASGDIGVAIVGSQYADGEDSGLSGTQFYAFNFFSKDHHSRDNAVDDWGTACLFIDGYTAATQADINGHYFHGGVVRSYGNSPIRFGKASNIAFFGTIFETPKRRTRASNATRFIATNQTRDVSFISCRWSDDAGLFSKTGFIDSAGGKVYIVGGPRKEISVYPNE